jgi:site-specific DNA-methyltransferase (adenine-specific)
MACNIEDAGFEIRDMIAWVYGSGFPKSLDVSKAIDAAAGAEREEVGISDNGFNDWTGRHAGQDGAYGFRKSYSITAPATDAAKQWHGWGTALKPAMEPITVARKPLSGTVAENVLKHGTGAINIAACRVGTDGGTKRHTNPMHLGRDTMADFTKGNFGVDQLSAGRWPANLIHDGSDEVLAVFPQAEGSRPRVETYGDSVKTAGYDDSGSAARFFYCAKANRAERDAGMEGLPEVPCGMMEDMKNWSGNSRDVRYRNNHPTVKPVALMEYLVRLVGRADGTVLDPFMGSGTTGIACIREGMKFIGIERDERYFEIARKRLEAELAQGRLPLPPIQQFAGKGKAGKSEENELLTPPA